MNIVMVMNLRRFIRHDQPSVFERIFDRILRPYHNIDRFDQLRGSSEYARFLKQFTPEKWFTADTEEARLEIQGHELSVFRQHLINNYFFPTYRLTDSILALKRDVIQSNPALTEQLAGWVYKIRLTRNGLVVVKLERELVNERLVDISQMILEIQRIPIAGKPNTTPEIPTQWQLAMDIVARFIEACDDQFVIDASTRRRRARTLIAFDHNAPIHRLPLHDRHIIYLFSKITDEQRELLPHDIKEHYAGQIVGLLENAMLIENDDFSYPEYKESHSNSVMNLDMASWKDEMCLITPETSIIFCPTAERSTAIISGSARTNSTSVYYDYWRSIARGIEHVVSLKNEVQLLERDTTRLLEGIPELTRKVADGNLSHADQRDIQALATGISTLFKSLPQQRDALVPSSVFRSSSATQKFQRLMQLLGIYEIEQHIETNVQELSAFLAHYNSIQLQQDAQRTNVVFSILTVAFTILAIPTFLVDLIQIGWLDKTGVSIWGMFLSKLVSSIGAAALQPAALLALVCVLVAMLTRFYRRR